MKQVRKDGVSKRGKRAIAKQLGVIRTSASELPMVRLEFQAAIRGPAAGHFS
jgi:hypothetical protein